jgi:hypothetical protein
MGLTTGVDALPGVAPFPDVGALGLGPATETLALFREPVDLGDSTPAWD